MVSLLSSHPTQLRVLEVLTPSLSWSPPLKAEAENALTAYQKVQPAFDRLSLILPTMLFAQPLVSGENCTKDVVDGISKYIREKLKLNISVLSRRLLIKIDEVQKGLPPSTDDTAEAEQPSLPSTAKAEPPPKKLKLMKKSGGA